MLLTSDPVSPIWPVPSDVFLTCIVELSPAVDIPVTVKTVWTGPDGIMILSNDTVILMQNLSVYTSTILISSFGRNQSGNYCCTASVNSTSKSAFVVRVGSLSGTIKVTTGMT